MGFLFKVLRRLLIMLIVPGLCVGAGWYGGAKYGASPLFINTIDGALSRGRAILTPILGKAVEQGGDYVAGTVEQMLQGLADQPEEQTGEAADEPAPETADAEPKAPAATPAQSLEGGIILCNMHISNPPRQGGPGESIGAADETVRYKGVTLLLMPATKSCLSSGFGYRSGKLHKGVDYYSDQGGDVLAAGEGTIVEAVIRADYGNMVVIDHGDGVYTRYAHLARFGDGVRKGAAVKLGQPLGPIGQTGAVSITHLHYEVLTGDYGTRAKSFGLEPIDPYGL